MMEEVGFLLMLVNHRWDGDVRIRLELTNVDFRWGPELPVVLSNVKYASVEYKHARTQIYTCA